MSVTCNDRDPPSQLAVMQNKQYPFYTTEPKNGWDNGCAAYFPPESERGAIMMS